MFVLLSVGASDTCKKTEEMVEVEWRLKCLFFSGCSPGLGPQRYLLGIIEGDFYRLDAPPFIHPT